MIPEDINKKREDIIRIARSHGVLTVRLFGSFARGDSHTSSDIDLLITVGPNHSRWFPGGLVADLEDLIGRRVDVVEEEALSSDVKNKIIRESVLL
jgi:uncharacterized protein